MTGLSLALLILLLILQSVAVALLLFLVLVKKAPAAGQKTVTDSGGDKIKNTEKEDAAALVLHLQQVVKQAEDTAKKIENALKTGEKLAVKLRTLEEIDPGRRKRGEPITQQKIKDEDSLDLAFGPAPNEQKPTGKKQG